MSHYADRYDRSLNSGKPTPVTYDGVQEYQEKNKKIRREKQDFLQREFDYRDYIFAPEGYEGAMLFLYIMTIPYLVALSFLFVFIAKSSYQLFLEFNLASFLVIWAIGYEICAVLAIILFFYSWFNSDGSDETPTNRTKGNRGITPRFRN
ncbi:MAG: hypothetical protein QG558_525 [Campylobacterota bacterium]|jgi:hypothetical protein|nr:hypothetical protein [Campylobacterota bacterium]